jgi:hypothetical protein
MKIAIIGHSHISCMLMANRKSRTGPDTDFEFVQLHKFKSGHMPGALNLSTRNMDMSAMSEEVLLAAKNASIAVVCITGNAPALFGLRNLGQIGADEQPRSIVPASIIKQMTDYVSAHDEWVLLLKKLIRLPLLVLPPPPPVGDNRWIQSNMGTFKEALERSGVSSPEYRLMLYKLWSDGIRDSASKNNVRFVELPHDVFNESGYLAEQYFGDEPSHANISYGDRLLRHLIEVGRQLLQNGAGADVPTPAQGSEIRSDVRGHPYIGLPDWAFWQQGVAKVSLQAFDPVVEVPFRISRADKVATAGSCFAQHISKRLRSGGFHFLVTEQPPDGRAECEGCLDYDFSARYGNIYTARQLVQLFDRAYGYFSPIDSYWTLPNHRFCDPFRPRIEADGYPSIEMLIEDRRRHLAAVREMFERLDVFVFTLGLTECWVSRLDGAAYPLAPGVAGGEFDPDKYHFVNFGVEEVVHDLKSFVDKLRLVNPRAKLILTVSPVPLAATYAASHVLVSTTYSKSVLRVAAEMVSRSCEGAYYFPSFEIITGTYNRGRYFGPDLRTVTEEGVDHVMAIFMRHLTDADTSPAACSVETAEAAEADTAMEEMVALADAACDEELLARE